MPQPPGEGQWLKPPSSVSSVEIRWMGSDPAGAWGTRAVTCVPLRLHMFPVALMRKACDGKLSGFVAFVSEFPGDWRPTHFTN